MQMLAEASGCDASSLPLPLVHHAPDAGPVDLLEEDTHDEGDPLELLVAGKVWHIDSCHSSRLRDDWAS